MWTLKIKLNNLLQSILVRFYFLDKKFWNNNDEKWYNKKILKLYNKS